MTEINGQTGTVTAVNYNALTFTVNINSTGFTTYTSGGNAQIVNGVTNLTNFMLAVRANNSWRDAELASLVGMTANGIVYPSLYNLSNQNEWAAIYPDVYGTTDAKFRAHEIFNAQSSTSITYGSGYWVSPGLNPATTMSLRHRSFPVPVGYPGPVRKTASVYGHRQNQRLGSTFTSGSPSAHRIGAGTRPPPPRRRK
jgi:hypothetical protein